MTSHKPPMAKTLADGTPACRIVALEVTRSCNLACRHCRAEAHPEPFEGELTTGEIKNLLDSFAEAGSPMVIFTGGEPLLRPDIFELIDHAHKNGLVCACSPNGTLIDAENARKLKEAGVNRCSISIDGPDAKSHDALRGVPGAFEASMRGIRHLREAGLPFQINTTVTRNNLDSFKDIFDLCQIMGACAWHIFLLVPTGRGKEITDQVISAREYEDVLHWFYEFRKNTDMHLKATCAPHYYRIMRECAHADGLEVNPQNFGMDAMTRGCLGGTGFCFISHVGQVQPCGYLPLDCGNVRQKPFPQIWRESDWFLKFRDKSCYEGKCGVCEYHNVCGGCRARAMSMLGNPLAEEPLCAHQPIKLRTGK